MKNRIHLSSRSDAHRDQARFVICHRGGAWPGLLLAGCCAVLTGFAHPAQAAAIEAWVYRYNNVVSNSTDQAVKVVSDAAGDIIVTGFTESDITGPDMLTIKYSGVDGSVLWHQRYNGPANGEDYPCALAVDGSGNVAVTGVSYNGSDPDYYTAKYAAADGALLWEKRYNGPANHQDSANAMVMDANGNVVVTGVSGSDFYTAKYAGTDGMLLWEQRYNGPANSNDASYAVAADGSGNVVVTGYSNNGTNYDCYTAKYAATDGALFWEQRYDGPANGDDNGSAVAVDGGGNVVVTGVSSGSNGYLDYYTAKYAASDGKLLWEKRYNGPANIYDQANAVAVDGSGNVVVTGFSYGSGGYGYSDYYTAKYAAADGAMLWEKRYNSGWYDEGRALAVDGNGNVVVTGSSGYSFPGEGYSDYYTVKYAAADGALLWERRYDGSANITDEAQAVAVDGSGNVIVTGFSVGRGSSADYYTAKYATADGALLWEQRYNGGTANNDDHAQAVAVDGSGNVVVTGRSVSSDGYSDYYTAKYAAANGALLWEKRYDSPENFYDEAKSVAVDGSGNVVVTGSSIGLSSHWDYYTAKYAAADGALLWEKRYDGSANGDDLAQAIAVDGGGNVVVTGYSSDGYKNNYCTVKYAAADGALLWEKGHTNGIAYAVAVDSSGNVIVTGYSSDNGSGDDYYTAKYAAADGALLWEQRYNGPANRHDTAHAVAVDASGNVVVTGTSGLHDDFSYEYYTAKYAAANGALLWAQRHHGSVNIFDSANAVAVDGGGNVVVTGYSHNGTNDDYYTAKYSVADGALLWEQRYNGSANSSDLAVAVAVDSSGNVVVTGTSYNGTNSYYYTAKYRAADGALLWEQRYNGGTASNLALGPNGMVTVTGSSGGDYATVVYRDDVYPISIALVPSGVRLRFTGIPGRSYTIERAPAVTGPWSILATPVAPLDGLVEYTDTDAPVGTAFYRTSAP